MSHIFDFFLDGYRDKETYIIALEAIVMVTGILSVWYAKRENILVYPIGLIATVITVYLFFKDGLLGDMMMNFYWSAMSIYGWWNWSREKNSKKTVQISRTTTKEKAIGIGLFIATMAIKKKTSNLTESSTIASNGVTPLCIVKQEEKTKMEIRLQKMTKYLWL